MFDLNPRVNDLSGIKDIVGIKGLFQHAHQVQSILAMLARHELLFMQTNAVLTGASAIRVNRLGHKLVVEPL